MQKKNSIVSVLDGFHISDRNDGCDDDDDEKGSRAYPSRTSWGAAFGLAEKFPFLFETRYFVKAYGYWNGYTRAQILLMSTDQPIVTYKPTGDKPKDMTRKRADEIYDRWVENNGVNSLAGETISLSDWLNNKI